MSTKQHNPLTVLVGFVVVVLIFWGIHSCSRDDSSGYRSESENKYKSLSEVVYDAVYPRAYNGGIEAGKQEKEENRAYEPELVLSQPIFQCIIKSYSDTVVQKYGESYRRDAERAFRDGFMAGYKVGYTN